MHHQASQHSIIDKSKKPKSPSASTLYTRQDSNLDEFQIEKVVSWMSVNEENFSEFEFSMTGQTNDNKSTDKSKLSEHDSTYQEIVDIIKEIEHDRKDCEDFKTLKTDVEFKLNTILNSIESPDGVSPSNECNDGDSGSNNKLKCVLSSTLKLFTTINVMLSFFSSNTHINLPSQRNLFLLG